MGLAARRASRQHDPGADAQQGADLGRDADVDLSTGLWACEHEIFHQRPRYQLVGENLSSAKKFHWRLGRTRASEPELVAVRMSLALGSLAGGATDAAPHDRRGVVWGLICVY
jgi:hypothetical protein